MASQANSTKHTKQNIRGNSLAVQWLGLRASTAEGLGFNP